MLELSIPLNGFPRRGSPALPSCPAVSLSIPLNGFLDTRAYTLLAPPPLTFNSIEWIPSS